VKDSDPGLTHIVGAAGSVTESLTGTVAKGCPGALIVMLLE